MSGGWILGGEDDTYALVSDAAVRDAYVQTGDWAAAGEPGDGDWVYIWHEGSAAPGRYPMSTVRELWGPRGHVPGPPPGGVSPFTLKPAADPVAKPKPSKSAAGGEKTEE